MSKIGLVCLLGLAVFVLAGVRHAAGASFDGSVAIQISDPTGGLSWDQAENKQTISCWMKIVIPSGTVLSQNMTVLADRTSGGVGDASSYWLYLNRLNGNLEFWTRGSAGVYSNTVIEKPYLDRWYHVAVVRDANSLMFYLDGQEARRMDGLSIGNSSNNNGVTIGGWGNSQHFRGEIQEVAIYRRALTASEVRQRMFMDLPPGVGGLVGYYKLGHSNDSSDHLRNFATLAPTNSSPGVKVGSGTLGFEEVDQSGEQSRFDSEKDRGRDAIAPLSGSFTWGRSLLGRATPGIGFDFQIGYFSSLAFANYRVGAEGNIFASPIISDGWRHSFETRIVQSTSTDMRLVMWNGAVETWDNSNGVWRTRHGEYRGELNNLPGGDFEWVTPDRTIFRFERPDNEDSHTKGRLRQIRDYNGNSVQVQWHAWDAIITQVVDSVGAACVFQYSPGMRLTNVSYVGWNASFEYDGENRLAGIGKAGPEAYGTNLSTRWTFAYDPTRKLLSTIKDPMSNTFVAVTYDAHGRVSEKKDALNRTNKTEYGKPDWRSITTIDPANQSWISTYDRKHRLVRSQNPLGHASQHAYDERGNQILSVDPLGNRTMMAYDERANLLAVTNMLGEVARHGYHPLFNKATNSINPLGWEQHFEYDEKGNLLRHWDDLGMLASYTYASNGLVLTLTDANGNVAVNTYNAEGFLIAATDAASNTTHMGVTELGWVTAVTNALGEVTTTRYDVNGNPVEVLDPISRVVQREYNANGWLVRSSDAKGQWSTQFYDVAGQTTQTVDRLGSKTATTYTPIGKPRTVTDPLGRVTTNLYDVAGRLTDVVDPLGRRIQMEYDAADRTVAVINQEGKRSRTEYDPLGRSIATIDPLGNRTDTTYDPAGRVATVSSPLGWTSTHEYDGRGRLRRWVDPGGYEWIYAYDGNGNVTNITDALGGRYAMTYGPRNERLTELNQDDFLWQYQYDVLGRLAQQTDPNGTTRTPRYDPAGRVEDVMFNTGRVNSFLYDENDNPLMAIRSGAGQSSTTTLFAYDELDRVVRVTDAFSRQVQYAYDAASRMTNMIYPGNRALSYRYDMLNRITNQTDWAGRQMRYAYDAVGRLVSRTYPNGLVQTLAFDDAGRLTALAHGSRISYDYAYDRNGNRTNSVERGTLPIAPPTLYDEQATFTPAGRLMDRTDAINPVRTFTYHYDPSGNMTNCVGGGQSYAIAYDEDNRVTRLDWDNGLSTKVVQNRYDALGRRVSRRMDGVETRYVLDVSGSMERILCDVNSAGSIQAWYVHGPGGLAYMVDADNQITCYHPDATGHVVALTDGQTNTTAQYAYSDYGRVLTDTGTADNPFKYVGSLGVMEELPGITFMRARYYSADAGVFLSTDPIRRIGPGERPVAYWYADGNPLKNSDAHGLEAKQEWIRAHDPDIPIADPYPRPRFLGDGTVVYEHGGGYVGAQPSLYASLQEDGLSPAPQDQLKGVINTAKAGWNNEPYPTETVFRRALGDYEQAHDFDKMWSLYKTLDSPCDTVVPYMAGRLAREVHNKLSWFFASAGNSEPMTPGTYVPQHARIDRNIGILQPSGFAAKYAEAMQGQTTADFISPPTSAQQTTSTSSGGGGGRRVSNDPRLKPGTTMSGQNIPGTSIEMSSGFAAKLAQAYRNKR
jgi:RHS repeat-associated protein